jgi:hypothetical protein
VLIRAAQLIKGEGKMSFRIGNFVAPCLLKAQLAEAQAKVEHLNLKLHSSIQH